MTGKIRIPDFAALARKRRDCRCSPHCVWCKMEGEALERGWNLAVAEARRVVADTAPAEALGLIAEIAAEIATDVEGLQHAIAQILPTPEVGNSKKQAAEIARLKAEVRDLDGRLTLAARGCFHWQAEAEKAWRVRDAQRDALAAQVARMGESDTRDKQR